ncbi:MAG: PHP domain-containing protein [Gemmatimonadota bacterium]|nr:MAG: PHP domain-containing protein [Gemmatimonadota bacterium]
MKIDLHLHTNYSVDGWATPEEMVRRAVSQGLGKVAITDHETIQGALAARRRYPDRVVIGEEILCRCGTHLIGLFLSEHVPSGLSIEATAERIRQQMGIVYGPHPFAYITHAAKRAHRVLAVSDVAEVFNSRAFLLPWNSRATILASQLSLPQAASSDAHFPWELGRAYTELPEFHSVEQFKSSLQQARPVGLRTGSPWLHVMSLLVAKSRWLGSAHAPLPPQAEDRAAS